MQNSVVLRHDQDQSTWSTWSLQAQPS